MDKHDLFNLNRFRDEKELLIVEGYPDALYFPALGLKTVVAVPNQLWLLRFDQARTRYGF